MTDNHLRQLRSVRRSLSVDSCHTLVRALILSRIDYCNGLLGGASNALLDQLDRVMRASARLILQNSKYDQITADMNNRLHWLDARARIDYKLCIMAFRCLTGSAPRYLTRCTVFRFPALPPGHTFDLQQRMNRWCQRVAQRQLVRGRLQCPAPLAGTHCRLRCETLTSAWRFSRKN